MNILIILNENNSAYRKKFNVAVNNLKKNGHNITYITQDANNIININEKSILLKIWNCFYLSYLIKKHKIQLLHSISYSHNLTYELASKITSIPIVHTCSLDKTNIENIFTIDNLENMYQNSYIAYKKYEIPIVMYHRFIKNNNEKGNIPFYLNIERLEKHFKFLRKRGYDSLTFSDLKNKGLIHRFKYGKKFIIITVDDGYADNYYLLFPLLKKYKFKAVFYIVTGASYNKWDDDNLQEPKIPLMNTTQLKEMVASGLVEIGGHTTNHPDLTKLTKEQQYQEIRENKLQLEDIIKQEIISFAYPYGLFNKYSKDIVQQLTYNFAVAVDRQASHFLHQDLFQIKRISIYRWDNIVFFWFKTTGYYWQMDKFYRYTIKLLVLIKKTMFGLSHFFIKRN